VAVQTLGKVHRRHLATQMRSATREAEAPAGWRADDTSASLSDHLLAELTSPSQAVIRRELAEILRSALADMNPIDREVLALRHFEELTNTEVAQVLGIQQKAASIRYMRALERLRGILDRFPGLVPESSQGK
jgi:RNA polymerase sigma-70 factor (ECF subfamily)